VAAALDDEAQIARAGEAHGGDDVSGILRGHDVGAGRRAPGAEPPGGFGQRGLVGDVEGIGEQLAGIGAAKIGHRHRREAAADGVSELRPVGRRRPAGLAGAHAGRDRRARGWDVEGGGGQGKAAAEQFASLH